MPAGEVSSKAKPSISSLASVRGWKSSRVALVGVGSRKEFSPDRLRRAATAGALAARQRRLTSIAIVHRPGTDVTPQEAAQVLTEGAILANFDGASYRTTDPPGVWVNTVQLRVGGEAAAVEAAVERGRVLGECTNLARTLSNERATHSLPRVFAERAKVIATDAGLTCEVLDETRIAELKMGLLLGVARGSQEPPRVVVLRHEPKKGARAPVLGLIGKGVTFDTGGISIKPAEDMDKMKDDMSGGAAVLCAMAAISRLQAPVAAWP